LGREGLRQDDGGGTGRRHRHARHEGAPV